LLLGLQQRRLMQKQASISVILRCERASASLEGWTATMVLQPGRRPSRLARFAHSHLRVTEIERLKVTQAETNVL
jgi:hypothetical protein